MLNKNKGFQIILLFFCFQFTEASSTVTNNDLIKFANYCADILVAWSTTTPLILNFGVPATFIDPITYFDHYLTIVFVFEWCASYFKISYTLSPNRALTLWAILVIKPVIVSFLMLVSVLLSTFYKKSLNNVTAYSFPNCFWT